jgi:hypothetical protein
MVFTLRDPAKLTSDGVPPAVWRRLQEGRCSIVRQEVLSAIQDMYGQVFEEVRDA